VIASCTVVEDVRPRLATGRVEAAVYPLAFQHPEEAFHGGIIGTTAPGTPTLEQVMALQEALGLAAWNLAPAVGLQDNRGAVRPLPAGHPDSVAHEFARRAMV
jgi:hypothetical protein